MATRMYFGITKQGNDGGCSSGVAPAYEFRFLIRSNLTLQIAKPLPASPSARRFDNQILEIQSAGLPCRIPSHRLRNHLRQHCHCPAVRLP